MNILNALVVGDTWDWIDASSTYPAPEYKLVYTLFSASGNIRLESTAEGSSHRFHFSSTQTATYQHGRYDYSVAAEKTGERYTVGGGHVQLLPDVSSLPSYDGRSFARRMVDAIDAILENRATDDELDLVKTQIAGRNLELNADGLLPMRQHFMFEVDAQERLLGNRPEFIQMTFS